MTLQSGPYVERLILEVHHKDAFSTKIKQLNIWCVKSLGIPVVLEFMGPVRSPPRNIVTLFGGTSMKRHRCAHRHVQH